MEGARGLDLPERVRQSIAAAVAHRGVQARVISPFSSLMVLRAWTRRQAGFGAMPPYMLCRS